MRSDDRQNNELRPCGSSGISPARPLGSVLIQAGRTTVLCTASIAPQVPPGPTCPTCHQKRALLTALHVAEEVCCDVAHRQVVFTIPKRLRLYARFDRQLLGKFSRCVWTCVKAEVQRLLGRDDVVPGMIATIQTHGELGRWSTRRRRTLAGLSPTRRRRGWLRG